MDKIQVSEGYTFEPIDDRIVLVREATPKKLGGEEGVIIASEAHVQLPLVGKVVAIGPKVEQVKEGDTVYFAKFAGVTIPKLKGDANTYVVLRERDELLMVLKEEFREETDAELAARLDASASHDIREELRETLKRDGDLRSVGRGTDSISRTVLD